MSGVDRISLWSHRVLAILGSVITISIVSSSWASDPQDREPAAPEVKLVELGEAEPIKFHAPPLYRKTRLDFEEAPLGEILKAVCQSVDLKLELDVDRLRAADYSPDTPITIKSDRIFLKDALSRVLKPFDRMSFTVDGDKIFVSTRQRVKARFKAKAGVTPEPLTAELLEQKDAVIPLEALADRESNADVQLHLPFNDSVENVPVSNVLADIAHAAGLVLTFDQAEIWAGGGNETLFSIPVTLIDVGERLHLLPDDPNSASWMQQAKRRGDGTIRVKEVLKALLEPLALDYQASDGVLLVSSYHTFEQSQNEKTDLHRSHRPSESHNLRTRIVTSTYLPAGKPLGLSIEVKNFGSTPESFDNPVGPLDRWIEVVGPNAKPVPFRGPREETVSKRMTIKPGQTVVLFQTRDFNESFDLTKVGHYTIQFRATSAQQDGNSSLRSLSDSYEIRVDIGEAKD